MSKGKAQDVQVAVSMIEDILKAVKERDETKFESMMTNLGDLLNESQPKKSKQLSSPTYGSSEHV
jgi:hypothetical protein